MKTKESSSKAFELRVLISLILLMGSTAITLVCCQDEGTSQPERISDGTLSEAFPRIGLSPEKLDLFKSQQLGTPEWTDIIARMSNMASTGEPDYGFGAFHFAVAYAVTGEQKYKALAKEIIFRVIGEPGYCDVTSSYLRAPDCTGQVALAADILFEELSAEERNTIFDYLETNARNIVEVKDWSGWGWIEGNPSYHQLNNYYPGHLQTILHYALLAYEHRDLAKEYFNLVVEEELPIALELVAEELKGGHGAEGTWYDDKLMGHYAEVVLMIREATEGRIDFGDQYSTVFADYVKFRMYSFNPLITENGKPQLYHLATGDQPAVAGAKAIDLARLRLWLLMDVLKNTDQSEAAGFVRHFEDNINFESKGWQREFKLYYLLHFDGNVPTADYTQLLDRAYLSEGKGLAHYRTGWDESALTVSIHFSPGQGQRNSHWHFGEGAFYLWNKGWQADHLNRIEGNGIRQHTGLMNTLLINRNEQSQGAGDASVIAFRGSNDFMAITGDATAVYKQNLEKFERTLLVTDRVVTVYDHVVKKDAGDEISFVINSTNGFHPRGGEPGKFTSENGQGRLTIKSLFEEGVAREEDRTLSFDFQNDAVELHLLHAMEAGDIGSSSCTMLPVEVEQAGAPFLGVAYLPQHRSYVHVVNTSGEKGSAVSYTVGSANPMEHLIGGLGEGNYRITKDGADHAQVTVDSSGFLHFESSNGGLFSIQKVN